jgi:hypothetical protein
MFETFGTSKRGRPRGSYGSLRHVLNPQERRVAMLHSAGLAASTIALELQTYTENILNILKRPHVANEITRISAALSDEIAPTARNIENELELVAGEAFDRTLSVMRRLDEVGEDALEANDLKNGIRAKLGVLTTAQDILDRAGKRAPTRTIGAVAHIVAPEQLEKLGRILGDLRGVGGGEGGTVGISINNDESKE